MAEKTEKIIDKNFFNLVETKKENWKVIDISGEAVAGELNIFVKKTS